MQVSCFLGKANSSQGAGFWGHSSLDLDLYPDSSTYWLGYWTAKPDLLISLRGSPDSEASCEDKWENRDLEKMFKHLYSQLLPVFTSFDPPLLSSSHFVWLFPEPSTDPSMDCVRGKTGEAQAGRIHTRKAEDSLWERKKQHVGKERRKVERGKSFHPVLNRVWKSWNGGGYFRSNFRVRQIYWV